MNHKLTITATNQDLRYTPRTRLEMELDITDATWGDILEEFNSFLRGLGYLIPEDKHSSE